MITISAPNPIRKLYLAIATIGVLSVSQGAWAWGCKEPQVSGYKYVDCLEEGLAAVKKDGKWGYIDTTGQVVVPVQYDDIASFREGLAKVKKDGKYGFVDKTGQVVIPLQYDYAWSFSEGLATVKKNGKIGYIDKTGKVVVPLQYDYLKKDFDHGRMFAEVKRNGDTYYVSKLGDEYTAVGSVSEGLVLVGNNKYGFIDKTGKMVIAPQYDVTWSFKNGQAKVGLEDGKTPRYFYIDKTGKVLTKRSSLAEFRKKLTQGDDVLYETSNDNGKGMIFEIKGNLVQVQTTEEQCTQRDYKGNCQNYVKNPVAKWVKRSEIYPANHWDL